MCLSQLLEKMRRISSLGIQDQSRQHSDVPILKEEVCVYILHIFYILFESFKYSMYYTVFTSFLSPSPPLPLLLLKFTAYYY